MKARRLRRFWLVVMACAAVAVAGFCLKPSLAISCADPPEGVGPSPTVAENVLAISVALLVAGGVIAAFVAIAKAFRAPLWLGVFVAVFAMIGGLTWIEWETFYSTDSCSNPFWARIPIGLVWLYAVSVSAGAAYLASLFGRDEAV